jgi:hypothetical protein
MLTPSIVPWVKQKDNDPPVSIGVDARKVRTFAQIAAVARETKVIEVICSTMLAGNDVLHVESFTGNMLLTQSAVLASVFGTHAHLLSQGIGHAPCWR